MRAVCGTLEAMVLPLGKEGRAMDARSRGVTHRLIHRTPIAIVDLETTGLNPGTDRVVEVSVVRMEQGVAPRLVFDTLVNPRRAMAATEIHGITDDDVVDAPEFQDIVGDFIRALAGCVVAAYNVCFDVRFLEYELRQSRVDGLPPHVCLMYLRPMLGLGSRCSLDDACREHGIQRRGAHVSAADAEAGAQLMALYLAAMQERHVATYEDLARLKNYKFTTSFVYEPLSEAVTMHLPRCERFKPRTAEPTTRVAEPRQAEIVVSRHALAAYWEALKTVIADLLITDAELQYLEDKRRQLRLEEPHVRALHARAFAAAINQFVDDQWLDEREYSKLRRLYQCLSRLGWAPGE